jgi:hypothetical protein
MRPATSISFRPGHGSPKAAERQYKSAAAKPRATMVA